MTTTSYEEAVRITQQMSREERRRFQLELQLAARPGADAATILRTTPPLDPADVDAMERAIEETCERTPVFEE